MKAIRAIIALALFLAVIGSVSALPINLEEVEVDDTILSENAENRLSLERGEEYEVRVRFTPQEDLDDVEIRIFVSGFECFLILTRSTKLSFLITVKAAVHM